MMNRTYLFLGDSITDSDHLWLQDHDDLGDGFVYMLSRKLNGRMVNRGIDGYTTAALRRKIETSRRQYGSASWFENAWQFPSGADRINLLIGINDIGVCQNTCLSLEEFNLAENYEYVLRALKDTNIPVRCEGPFIFPHPQCYSSWIPDVLKAESVMKDIATSMSIPFLPLHSLLNDKAQSCGCKEITTDGIHLTQMGHRYLADLLTEFLA